MRLTVGRRHGPKLDTVGVQVDHEDADSVVIDCGNEHGVGDLRRWDQLLASVDAPAVPVTAGGGRRHGGIRAAGFR